MTPNPFNLRVVVVERRSHGYGARTEPRWAWKNNGGTLLTCSDGKDSLGKERSKKSGPVRGKERKSA